MKPIWRCKCGYEQEDDGRKPLQSHMLKGNNIDGPGVHGGVQLIDKDTGDVLVDGASRATAEQQGYVGPADEAKSKAATKAATEPKQKSNLRTTVPYRTLTLPPSIEGYFSLYCAAFPGRWEATNDGMAEWVSELIEAHTKQHRYDLLGLDPKRDTPEELNRAEALLRSIRGMDGGIEEDEPQDEVSMLRQELSDLQLKFEALQHQLLQRSA